MVFFVVWAFADPYNNNKSNKNEDKVKQTPHQLQFLQIGREREREKELGGCACEDASKTRADLDNGR